MNLITAISKNKATLLVLLAMFAIAFSTRVFFLDRVSPGVLQDEVKHIMTEKSLLLTGKSIYKDWNPFSLTSESHDVKDSELLPVIMSPYVGMLPYTMYFVRLPFALLGVMDVFLISLIGYFLFGKKPALVVGLLAAINPYLIFFSRLAFDTHVAMFFMLLGIVLLFLLKKWWKIVAFISFGFAFYSYTGLKLLFFPLILFFSFWFAFVYQKKEKMPYLVVAVLSCFLVVYFALTLHTSATAQRYGEILAPSSEKIGKEVIFERTNTLLNPLIALETNKFTVWENHVVSSYLEAFSLQTLFATGENSTHLALWYVGYFYLIDLVFIILGIFFLFAHNKKVLLFLGGIILLAPVTGAVDALGSHVMHAMLMFPALILVAGYGLFTSLVYLRKKSPPLMGIILMVYLVSFGSFLYIYFLRFPIYNSEGFNFANRVLAHYIAIESASSHVIVFTQKPDQVAQQYVLYNSLYKTSLEAEKINAAFRNQQKTGTIKLGNILFLISPEGIVFDKKDTIVVSSNLKIDLSSLPATVTATPLNVPMLTDGGAVFSIYQGKTCSGYLLKRYPQGIRFSDLAVEKLPISTFCQTFITTY